MTIWLPEFAKESGRSPLYRAIARSIETDVLAGRLRPGDRLPTHRELADRLHVTVGTVSRGYDEARRAGWISGEVGRGTFVIDRNAGRFPASASADDLIDLTLNVPVDSPAPDLAAALRAVAADADAASLLRYALTDRRRDRLAGARVLRLHGLEVDPDRIVLCAGAQHGLSVALESVARPGDTVLAEELTYPGFRPLAEARGLRIAPVAIDGEGIVPKALDAACRKSRPKALYLVPTLHNPTTITLSLERRRAVVEVARRHGVTILEDDTYRMLASDPPPPLAHLAPQQAIYVATLSKCLAPGLRVGYVVAPQALHSRVVRAVLDSVWMISPISAALANHWVIEGAFEAISAAKRRESAARQAIWAKLMTPGKARAATTAYHQWLPVGRDAEEFAHAARSKGVLVTPGSAFHLGSGAPPRAVRVSLSAARDRAVLATALGRLRETLDDPARVARAHL